MTTSRAREPLRSATGGNVAIIFALASLPLLLMGGAAVDYGLAARQQVRLQAAADATLLNLCQTPLSTTTAQLQAQAGALMTGYVPDATLLVDPLTVTPATASTGRQIAMAAHVGSLTFFGGVTGVRKPRVTGASQCATPIQKTFEIALVLDNTYSMLESSGSTSKIQALKTAASNFVSYIYSNSAFASNSRIAIVPFTVSVRLDPTAYANASWVDTAGSSAYHWTNIDKQQARAAGFTSRFSIFAALQRAKSTWGWGGCFESLPYPLDTQDGAPTSNDTLYVPMMSPDEPGAVHNASFTASNGSTYPSSDSYLNDTNGATGCNAQTDFFAAEKQACKYVNVSASSVASNGPNGGPNQQCTVQALQRLTSDTTQLNSVINGMVADNSTNIHEGLIWGWRTLSPLSVFVDGAAYNAASTAKVMILMTDGYNYWPLQNTPNQTAYVPGGYLRNADGSSAGVTLPPAYSNATTVTQLRNGLDQASLETCTNAKTAGVTIYTIGFSIPSDPIDAQGLQLLRSCASSSSNFFVANDSNGLIAAFAQISRSLGSLRLTQ